MKISNILKKLIVLFFVTVVLFVGMLSLPIGYFSPKFAQASVGDVYGGYTVTDLASTAADTIITESGKVYEVTGTTNRAIIVQTGVSTVLVLAGTNRAQDWSRLQVEGTSDVTLYLVEDTTNIFRSTGTNVAQNQIQAGIYVAPDATLTIEGPGKLEAYGGRNGAGIGGIYTSAIQRSGTIIIKDGIIAAQGGDGGGAGIGGGSGNPGGITKIYGGTITAQGSPSDGGAGIGGGGSVPDRATGGFVYMSRLLLGNHNYTS